MKIFYGIVLLGFQKLIFIHALMENIINNLQLKHATVIKNYEKDRSLDDLFKKIVEQVPSTIIDFSKIESNRTFAMKTFQNPRQSTIYIILQGKNTAKFEPMKMKHILSRLASMSPLKMRPKCLVMKLGSLSEGVFYHAWTLKFLDFTVLSVSNGRMNYISYNPFKKTYDRGYLKNETDLFPEKLTDVNKHPMKLSVLNYASLLESEKHECHERRRSHALRIPENNSRKVELRTNSVLSVHKGETSMTALGCYFSDKFSKLDVLPGNVM